MQLRHYTALRSPLCRRAPPSLAGAATAAWPGAVSTVARPSPRPMPALGEAAGEKLRPVTPRVAAHRRKATTSSSATSVEVGGKLLFHTFAEASGNQLKLSFQLVSATVAGGDGYGVKGEEAMLEAVLSGEETQLDVTLLWDEAALGSPGAVIVRNHSDFPVYLKLLSLPTIAGPDGAATASVHFACHGWVYPVGKHPYRLFFTNDAYVKEKTPGALLKYREDELRVLRGEAGASSDRAFQEWDRVYDYAVYNDLGNPDLRNDLARPVLGGSNEYPYPRRTKTGRPPANKDPQTESRAPLDQQIYVPCDERVGAERFPAPSLPNLPGHFESFAEIYRLVGLDDLGRLPQAKEIINSSGTPPKLLPIPHVISVNPRSWRKDEEFARQMLAGSNPVCIRRVTEFPITSELDRAAHGDQDSKITGEHIERNMGGVTVRQAMEAGRLFVVDHHDWVMPYLSRINALPGDGEHGEVSPRMAYAARTLLFLDNDDSTLRPLAIELSSPHPDGERLGAVSTVHVPPDEHRDVTDDDDDRFTAWDLAKAHAAVNDACYNNFVVHWLRAHASMEPIVIAANRQLSVLHPIHRLLKPHFRNTLNANAVGRQIIFGSGDMRSNGDVFRGIHEVTFLASKYGIEKSSMAYKSWNFTQLALPTDLVKRGVARGDPKNPETLELLIKDYPYAVDGLDVWAAIKNWVADYCAIYYVDDGAVAGDGELQAWWREVRHVGHGDHRDAAWWPAMDCAADLVEACATVVWLGSAFHAAVGLGQFPYQGFPPGRPTITSRPVPEAAMTAAEFLGGVTPRKEAVAYMVAAARSVALEGEVCLGQRPDTERWTSERRAGEALARFRARLAAVAGEVERRNADPALKNRAGAVEVPYTQLAPAPAPGPAGRGIPNSITS
ncbi:hypothetical protein ACP4OV_027918 [Aristida adscensionis]